MLYTLLFIRLWLWALAKPFSQISHKSNFYDVLVSQNVSAMRALALKLLEPLPDTSTT